MTKTTSRAAGTRKVPRLPSIAVLNRRFAKMTIVQKRHTIARDALALLAARKLIPTSGQWVTYDAPISELPSKDLQTVLRTADTERCQACALGGAICSLAWNTDRVKLKDSAFRDQALTHYDAQATKLREIWSEEQLALIEDVFERGYGHLGGLTEPASNDDTPASNAEWDAYDKRCERASRFHQRYQTEAGLYRAIFKAILKHPGGLFVP